MSYEAASPSFISRFVAQPVRNFVKRSRERRQLAGMLTMSDALLHDVGLTRFDIQSALRAKGGLTANAMSRISTVRGATVHVAETACVPVSVSESLLKAA